MVLNKIPTFDEVKNWVNGNTATSVNGKTGDVKVDTSQPITRMDSAETFSETDLELSTTGTVINSESVSLQTFSGSESYARMNAGTGSISWMGLTVEFNKTGPATVTINVGSTTDNTEMTGARIVRESDGEIIQEHNTSVSPGGSFTFDPIDVEAGERYDFEGENSGYNSYDTDPSASNNVFDVIECSNFYGDTLVYLDGISADVKSNSGNITTEWPYPDNVYSWDAATFQSTSDGETVEVYVEESTDGGSTWTEIQGPISRNDEIQADPGSRVRFRVELSRSDTSNNPTLDAIYRRWEV
jgi:hypothetical protein